MSSSRQTLSLYWQFIRKYPGHLIGLAAVIPLTILLQTFIPSIISADILTTINHERIASHNIWHTFSNEVIIFSISIITGTVLGPRIMMILVWGLEKRVEQDMAQYIFNYLLNQSADFHANNFSGAIVSQANKFISAYKQIADATTGQFSVLLCTLLFTVIFLWTRAPWFIAALLVLSILYIISTIFATRFIRHLHSQESQAQSTQVGYFADSITNILAIKSFATEKLEAKQFAKAIAYTRKCSARLMSTVVKRDIYFSSIASIIRITALILAILSVLVWHANIGTIFLVLVYTNILAVQLWQFSGNTARTYNNAFGDARDMTQILLQTAAINDLPHPSRLRLAGGEIAFKNVHFAHKDMDKKGPLFTGFNLHIAPGERLGLVGHSGSGKTTLTKLLLRFADINKGTIEIDGQSIAQVSQQDLRRHIAYVPQEPMLFHRTVAENIAYGRPDATQQEIKNAAQKAYAAEFIAKLPKGYDTLVGERGVKLSGGQRQRIAIARAILKDAPILILDEATSALDSESEKFIQKSLEILMHGRTTIVIAHRLSTIQKMDRIVVLHNGQITEQGTHTALLKNGGIYAGLWAHQSGGFLES